MLFFHEFTSSQDILNLFFQDLFYICNTMFNNFKHLNLINSPLSKDLGYFYIFIDGLYFRRQGYIFRGVVF